MLKAIAAMGERLAMGPWDKKLQPSAGRLANHLEIHTENLSALAREGVETSTGLTAQAGSLKLVKHENNDVKTFGKNCHSLSIPSREGLSTTTH
jgi:hypothetical protein